MRPFPGFTLGPPVYGTDFFDREEEIGTIVSGISRNNYALIGPRRSGKTSLMMEVASRLRDQFATIYLDVGTIVPLTEKSFLRTFMREVMDAYASTSATRRLAVKFKSFVDGSREFLAELLTSTHISIKETVEIWFNYIDGRAELTEAIRATMTLPERLESPKPFLIMLDEFPILLDATEQSFAWALRSYIHRAENARYIISGSEVSTMEHLTSEESSPFYGSAVVMRIGPLDLRGSRELLRSLERRGIGLTRAFVKRAVEATGRFPYYLQALGMASELYSSERGKISLGAKDFDGCLEKALDLLEGHFEGMLARLRGVKREILIAMALKQLTRSQEISPFLEKDASYILNYLSRLVEDGILTKVKPGTYDFVDPLFPLWIRHRMA